MGVIPNPFPERRLMHDTHYTSFAASATRWLTPHVWKLAHQVHAPKKVGRWDLHPLLTVLLLMTWTSGDSAAERFVTAQACYVASHQHAKRAGLQQVFHRSWRRHGFVVLACDGSRQQCPRSAELEKRLGCCGKKDSAPMLFITALVLLPAGLLWAWNVGLGTASEHDQLRLLLNTLPRCTLLVADAFYQGYDLYVDIMEAKASFLVRLSSRSQLYTDKRVPLKRFREAEVWYWTKKAQEQDRPALRLRLIRVRGKKKQDVWLLTNVLDRRRLGRRQAAEMYHWRWHAEGVFRTYKRTLPKIKLWSRTEALVYREAEVSLLGLQLVLAQSAAKCRHDGKAVIVMGSPRQELLRIRSLITTTIGVTLGPWQRQWYQRRLAHVQTGGGGRKIRRKWPRRKDHKAPKSPKIRVLPKRLKAKMAKRLNAA